MNIKISKEHHERLCKADYVELVFGSHLFGTNDESSDLDLIRIYDDEDVFGINLYKHFVMLPIHSFQYDDSENNQQIIWCTKEQYAKSIVTGDGTMFIDTLIFADDSTDKDILEFLRTYKVIKAYLGVAKRDLKLHPSNVKKLFHAQRSLYIAESLINHQVPRLEEIRKIKNNLKSSNCLVSEELLLRSKLNTMLNNREISLYSIPPEEDSLLKLLLDSNNITEFKYENNSNGGL